MRGLIVDSFAGGGGASTGIEMGLGRSPDIAINHDPDAIAMHMANHPGTRHLISNVWQVDPEAACDGKPVDLAWFSPDCKHFSKAKGGKPVERRIRDLAWIVVLWAQKVRPTVILLENVEEFADWGPLLDTGQPCPDRKGFEFKRWVRELRRLGYRVEWRELRACDFGAPTIRKRLFLVARCDGKPIVWPVPTHGPGLIPYRTAAEIIDWSLPCPSIFLSREEARAIGVKRPLADATMARIAAGVKRYVLDAASPFIINITHHGPTARVEPIDEPLRTVTGAHRGEKALITPFLAGCGGRAAQSPPKGVDQAMNTVTAKADQILCAPYLVPRYGERPGQEPRTYPVDAPAPTIVPTANGGSLVAAFLAQHNGGMVGHDAREPVSTLTQRATQQAVVSAGLLSLKGSDRRDSSIEAPVPAICAQGRHVAEVRAFLIKYFGTAVGQPVDEPLHTVTAKPRFGLVMIHGEPYEIVDIGMRMLSPRELFRAQGFPDSYIIDPVVDGRPLTKTAQIRMCGNSVVPQIAAALAKANAPDVFARPSEPIETTPLFAGGAA